MDYSSVNTIWVLLGAALVFFMQAGFAMVETGFTRAKNAGNIIMKNLMDFCIGTPTFWIVGFGIMFGAGNGFFGRIGGIASEANYGSSMLPDGVPFWAFLIFQTVFCATSATIVSGSHGGTYQIFFLLYLQLPDQPDRLSCVRSLDLGRRFHEPDGIPRFCRFLCSTYGRRCRSIYWCDHPRTSYR